MRKSSTGRSSSVNPTRISSYDREDRSAGPSDVRRTQTFKTKGSSQIDNSQIPRPRIRSSSSERHSIRKSNLKITAKTPLKPQHHAPPRVSSCTPLTPKASANRLYSGLHSASRHRSPSAERASGFGGKAQRKDSRPINDKAYQSAILGKIDRYFARMNQHGLLNPSGTLRPITLKMFVETTCCLLRPLGVKQDVGINNYTEELPKVAKKVLYPGTVTKSWLKTANTMHSWPQVLAWLGWLVEICEAEDYAASFFKTEKLPFAGADDEGENNRKTFLAMLKCYQAWNNENLEEEASLVEQHIRELNDRYGDIDSDIAESLVDLRKDKANYEEANRRSALIDEEIHELKRTLDNLAQEDAEELEYIGSLESSLERNLLQVKQLDLANSCLEAEIRDGKAKRAELTDLIEKQSMSAERRDAIIQQCTEIESSIRYFDDHVKDIEKELYLMEIKFAASHQNLYKAILAYNKDVIMHLACDEAADLTRLKMPETNMLSPDFMEQLQDGENAMLNIKERIAKRLNDTNELIEKASHELETVKDKLRVSREENKNHMEKITERKINAQQAQRKANETELKLRKQMKNVEIDILKIESSIPDLESAVAEVEESRDKYDAVLRRQLFFEQSGQRFFKKFYEKISKHRNDIAELLKKIP